MSVPPIRGPIVDTLKVTVASFGYLHGPVPDAHIVCDLRTALHNPAADPGMRALTGLEPQVREHVLTTAGAAGVLSGLLMLTRTMRALHEPQWRVIVAVGCAGGRHRSVVIANELAARLNTLGIATDVEHRDILRPVVGGESR